MSETKKSAGRPLITTISTGCKTPVLEVKFCNLYNAYYYPNSPTIPRHSVTCIVDPEIHKDFLNVIRMLEKNEKVATVIKDETKKEDGVTVLTGNNLIKFQSKDIIPVYSKKDKESEPVLIQLEEELEAGEKVMVVYDILRYTKKGTGEVVHGITFKPSCIYHYPSGV